MATDDVLDSVTTCDIIALNQRVISNLMELHPSGCFKPSKSIVKILEYSEKLTKKEIDKIQQGGNPPKNWVSSRDFSFRVDFGMNDLGSLIFTISSAEDNIGVLVAITDVDCIVYPMQPDREKPMAVAKLMFETMKSSDDIECNISDMLMYALPTAVNTQLMEKGLDNFLPTDIQSCYILPDVRQVISKIIRPTLNLYDDFFQTVYNELD